MLSSTSRARRMNLCSCIRNFVDFMLTPSGRGPDRDGKDRDVGVANHFLGRCTKKNSIHAASSAHRHYDEINCVLIGDPYYGVRRYSFGKDGFDFYLACPGLCLDLSEGATRFFRKPFLFRIEDSCNLGSLVGDLWPFVDDMSNDD